MIWEVAAVLPNGARRVFGTDNASVARAPTIPQSGSKEEVNEPRIRTSSLRIFSRGTAARIPRRARGRSCARCSSEKRRATRRLWLRPAGNARVHQAVHGEIPEDQGELLSRRMLADLQPPCHRARRRQAGRERLLLDR